MEAPVFSLRGVSKSYKKGFWGKKASVLHDINLEIFRGESVGFIGHNGAGKSSTIRLMLGLQQPTSGVVEINGFVPNNQAVLAGVGYLPESPLLYDYLTPRELLRMAMGLHGLKQDESGIGYWLDRFRVNHVADRVIKGFSKGMGQRVALAMVMCIKPKVLVLDEPLSGLDPIGRKEVVDVLEEYRQAGNTLFFSSHVLSDVERLADRFVFIYQGQVKANYGVSQVLEAASDCYEVTVYSEDSLASYEKTGRNLWRTRIKVTDLPEELGRLDGKRQVLHSVRSAMNIEGLYLELIGEANRDGR